MINYVKENKKGLLIVIIAFTITLTLMLYSRTESTYEVVTLSYEPSDAETPKELTEEERLDIIIEDNRVTINFLADTFKIDRDVFVSKIKTDYKDLGLLNDNINFDKVLIEYLFNLESSEKELFSNSITPCDKSKDYIIALISYYCTIYDNVDYNIAAAIAEIESGYSSRYMLNKNNIFGGMYSGGLIGYKDIEYGTLSYIRLLSNGYFGKGLTTVEAIGYVYNPIVNESGVKVASPTWVYNVNIAKEKYANDKKYTSITDIVSIGV